MISVMQQSLEQEKIYKEVCQTSAGKGAAKRMKAFMRRVSVKG